MENLREVLEKSRKNISKLHRRFFLKPLENFPKFLWIIWKHLRISGEICRKFFRIFWEILRKFWNNVSEIGQNHLRTFPEISRKVLRNVFEMFWKLFGNVSEFLDIWFLNFWKILHNYWEPGATFRKIWRRNFQNLLKIFLGTLKYFSKTS